MSYAKSVGRSPRRALTRAEIVDAAEIILERNGYDALTIRRVAAELGVKSASLYWHFTTKEELEDALSDRLLARLGRDYVSSGDWQEDIRRGSLHMLRRLFSLRDSSRLLVGRLLTGPNALRWMEAGLKPFLEAGLNKRDVAYASHAVHVYIQGFSLFRSAPLSAVESKGRSRRKVLESTRKIFRQLSPASFPNIVALAEALTDPDIEARFLFGLDCLIAGIAQRAGAREEGRRPRRENAPRRARLGGSGAAATARSRR